MTGGEYINEVSELSEKINVPSENAFLSDFFFKVNQFADSIHSI